LLENEKRNGTASQEFFDTIENFDQEIAKKVYFFDSTLQNQFQFNQIIGSRN